MLEKDKNYIEFSMRSMMIAQKRYQEDIEIEVTGMIPGREILTADNSFDVPCEVVMVPKREFERLQTENEELKKKLHEFDPIPDYKELLEKLYSTEDVEKLEWTLNHICGGQASVNGWIAVSLFWKQNYETLSKLVGFSSVEEIQDYLTNEANCDTLHEAILKLIDESKYACEEWCKAGELIEKWRKATGCQLPIAAKTLIESGTFYEHGYHEVREENRKLTDEVKSWQNVTGRSDPEAAKQYIDRLKGRLNKIHDCAVDW